MIKGNGGIGFELASQLITDSSKHVLLGSRSVEKGEAAVKELQSRNQPGTVELLHVDVTSDESITAAAKSVESKHGRYLQLSLSHLECTFFSGYADQYHQTRCTRQQRRDRSSFRTACPANVPDLPNKRYWPSVNGRILCTAPQEIHWDSEDCQC